MSPNAAIWLASVGIGLTGVVTRASCIAFGERLQLPPLLERALRHASAAALSAIVAPALLASGDAVDLSPGNHRLVAGLIAAAVMAWTRSMLWTLAVGIAAFTVLRVYG